jgi:hypothetical protein
MAAATVRITGLKELQRALRQVDKSLGADFKNELKKVGEPVARSAASKLTRWRGASTKVRVHPLGKGVFVRQQARKVTGLRGDFGELQMRDAFEPALDENQHRIVQDLDDAIDRFINHAGF